MRDWSDEDDEQDEYGDDDVTDDDAAETVPCPDCGADVYEDAEQCRACGSYIVPANHSFAGRPIWWTILGLLGIAAVIWVFVLSGF